MTVKNGMNAKKRREKILQEREKIKAKFCMDCGRKLKKKDRHHVKCNACWEYWGRKNAGSI